MIWKRLIKEKDRRMKSILPRCETSVRSIQMLMVSVREGNKRCYLSSGLLSLTRTGTTWPKEQRCYDFTILLLMNRGKKWRMDVNEHILEYDEETAVIQNSLRHFSSSQTDEVNYLPKHLGMSCVVWTEQKR